MFYNLKLVCQVREGCFYYRSELQGQTEWSQMERSQILKGDIFSPIVIFHAL
jgi:hypothetical protein